MNGESGYDPTAFNSWFCASATPVTAANSIKKTMPIVGPQQRFGSFVLVIIVPYLHNRFTRRDRLLLTDIRRVRQAQNRGFGGVCQ
jgi:hypothetical protein